MITTRRSKEGELEKGEGELEKEGRVEEGELEKEVRV